MELWQPEQLDVDGTSNTLIEDVEETARRVNELRPLSGTVLKRIRDDLLGERVYSSNAIEGNTLDLRETKLILKTGKISGGRKREEREARNLGQAVNKITTWVDSQIPCHTAERLLEVHAVLLKDIDDQWGGRYRDKRVMIQGATRQPPEETLVEPLMKRLLERLGRPGDTNTLLLATWAHWGIARIHPFYDGNGRMARLWQDLVLLRGRLTCAIIRPQDRNEYLEALGQADEGDFNPLIQLVAQRVSMTFDKYDAALREDEVVETRIKELVGEADMRLEEERKLAYKRWSRKMEQLRWEFELCASKITDTSRDVKIQLRKHDLIDQTRWENLRTGAPIPQTGFFSIDFSCKKKRLRYFFFFGKHYWSDLDNQSERSENRVCLLISEDDTSGGEASRLDLMQTSSLSLREIFVVDDHFVRKQLDLSTGKLVYDRGASPLEIALDFIQEVILNRLT